MDKARNQREDVLNYLQTYGSITQIEAYKNFPAPITRLSAVIFDLKKLGYKIDRKMISTNNCYGAITFARYYYVGMDEEIKED